MQILKTYDLKNIKDTLQKQIDATMKTNSSIVKIDLLTAVYITDILETVISMEEEKTIQLNKILKDLGCEEVEHPETEMIEGELESYILRLEDKDRELKELRRHLEHLKEAISIKNEQLNNLISENSELEKENNELKKKFEFRKDCFSLMKGCKEICFNCEESKACVNAVLKKEECMDV